MGDAGYPAILLVHRMTLPSLVEARTLTEGTHKGMPLPRGFLVGVPLVGTRPALPRRFFVGVPLVGTQPTPPPVRSGDRSKPDT